MSNLEAFNWLVVIIETVFKDESQIFISPLHIRLKKELMAESPVYSHVQHTWMEIHSVTE
jgi:hypothetical protein